jgi:formylglycine-generating enzyme required for sulfatase activity
VIRGGSWRWDIRAARCARRQLVPPDNRWDDVGFRCVREVPPFLPALQ